MWYAVCFYCCYWCRNFPIPETNLSLGRRNKVTLTLLRRSGSSSSDEEEDERRRKKKRSTSSSDEEKVKKDKKKKSHKKKSKKHKREHDKSQKKKQKKKKKRQSSSDSSSGSSDSDWGGGTLENSWSPAHDPPAAHVWRDAMWGKVTNTIRFFPHWGNFLYVQISAFFSIQTLVCYLG